MKVIVGEMKPDTGDVLPPGERRLPPAETRRSPLTSPARWHDIVYGGLRPTTTTTRRNGSAMSASRT